MLFESQDKSGAGGSGGRLSLLGKTEVRRGAGGQAQALNSYLYYLLVVPSLKKLAVIMKKKGQQPALELGVTNLLELGNRLAKSYSH